MKLLLDHSTTLQDLIAGANPPRWKPGWTDSQGRKKKGFWYFNFNGGKKCLTKHGAPGTCTGSKGSRAERQQALDARNRWLGQCMQKQASDYNSAMRKTDFAGPLIVDVMNYYIRHRLTKVKNSEERRRYCENFATAKDGGSNGIEPYKGYGKLPLKELRGHHVDEWIEAHPNWRYWARRKAVGVIKTAINFFVSKHDDVMNPINGYVVTIGYEETDSGGTECFTEAEEVAVKTHACDAYRVFISACLDTGARPGELAAAMDSHIAETASGGVCIKLPPHLWKNGFRSRKPKSHSIPLPLHLQDYVRARAQSHPGEYLFVNSKGTPWNQASWSKAFNDARDRANNAGDTVRESLRPYSTRHTFITRKLKRGLELREIAIVRRLAIACGTSEEEIRKTYDHVLHEFESVEEVVNL